MDVSSSSTVTFHHLYLQAALHKEDVGCNKGETVKTAQTVFFYFLKAPFCYIWQAKIIYSSPLWKGEAIKGQSWWMTQSNFLLPLHICTSTAMSTTFTAQNKGLAPTIFYLFSSPNLNVHLSHAPRKSNNKQQGETASKSLRFTGNAE